jgi:predicted pyridoxine 5'-phosphate oxidase superfamily flavin-nucleotide-binding protein
MSRLFAEAAFPFHAGELAVQERAGVREHIARVGPQVIRSAMPQQHRDLFALLPFLVLGALDERGQPWATLLAGASPGFAHAIDGTHLRIDALPPRGDPLADLVKEGAALAVLGIELSTRRRNRANGRIEARDGLGFTLRVLQSFGNCPKYIQRREALPWTTSNEWGSPQRTTRLDASMRAQISAADTFFIATHAAGQDGNGGSDVSHRGGLPGFVRVSDDGRTLTWPDFSGNAFFNTLGNIAAQSRSGLVFPDFSGGGQMHVNGRARIVWDGPQLVGFAGAERLVHLDVDEVLWRPGALRQRWRLCESSPALQGTGTWG